MRGGGWGLSRRRTDMTTFARRYLHITLAAAAGFGCLCVNDNASLTEPQSLVMSSADARVGRPATPRSYAGVARRTTRRAVAVGATAGAAAATACHRVVGANGRVYTRCY